MNSRELVRVTSCDQEQHRHLVQQTQLMFASLCACLHVGAVDSAPQIRNTVVPNKHKKGHSHSLAASLLHKSGLSLNRECLIIGNIPGVFVGDAFRFQAEFFVLGLHEDFQGGINCFKTSSSSEMAGLTIATSVVMSGCYEDNVDDEGDVLIYSGQGGQNPGCKKQTSNQELKDSNLALKNSMDYGVEIRVIRGIKLNRNDKMIYFYGLYSVKRCWSEPGKSGFLVYKFMLQRLPNQGIIGSMMYRKANQLRASILNLQNGQGSFDLSNGRELMPVGFYNNVDSCIYPKKFKYLPQPVYEMKIFQTPQLSWSGCNCTENCSASAGNRCSCVSLNGGELPYSNTGVLLHGKPVVFECGPHCCCPPTCRNRVTQKGLTPKLQVRSPEFIPAGTFVCEVTGHVISCSEQEQEQYLNKLATNNHSVDDPIFMFPGKLPQRWMEWGNDITQVLPGYQLPKRSTSLILAVL